MNVNIPQFRAVCGNNKCRELDKDPVIEFNFFTGEVIYICQTCGHENKISMKEEATPLPRTRVRRG